MLRALACLLLFLGSAALGCSKTEANPHEKSIPKIPPGRSAVGPDGGEKAPVVAPGKPAKRPQ